MERSLTSPLAVHFNEDSIQDPGSGDDDDQPGIPNDTLSFLRLSLPHVIPLASSVDIWLAWRGGFATDVDELLCLPPLPHLLSLTYLAGDDLEGNRGTAVARARRFLRGAPALTRLILGGIVFSMDGLCLPCLVRLELRVSMAEGPHVLISFLEQAPQLQYLHLVVTYTLAVTHAPIKSMKPTHLPYLRTLYLESTLSLCIAHLHALPYPSETLSINVSPYSQGEAHEVLNWQKDLFNHVHKLMDTKRSNPHGFVQQASHPGNVRLNISHPGTEIVDVHFCTHGIPENLRSALECLHSITVAATMRDEVA